MDYTQRRARLSDAPTLGSVTVEAPGNGRRKVRMAHIDVLVAEMGMQPPQRRGHAKASSSSEPALATITGATEPLPSAGSESIRRALLTNLPVQNFEYAAKTVRWHGEIYGNETKQRPCGRQYKLLKSGCYVKDCPLGEAERLKCYFTLFSVIRMRLMRVATLARVKPDLPETEAFSVLEIWVPHLRVTRAQLPGAPALTLCEAARLLSNLGGHIGRKEDGGEPSVLLLWRGWMRLYESVGTLQTPHSAGLVEARYPMRYCRCDFAAKAADLTGALLIMRQINRARHSRNVSERLN